MDISQRLSLGMYFTAFFVMLGPVKLIAPFAHLTADLDSGAARRVALQGIGVACVGGAVAAVMGQRTLATWGVSRPALLLAVGIVLFVVALTSTMASYAPPNTAPRPAILPPHAALSPLAVPLILTPYGMATFILILAITHDLARQLVIFSLFLVIMLLDLGVMWFVRPIMRWGGGLLALVGSVLGVLQVALGLQLSLEALGLLHILPSS